MRLLLDVMCGGLVPYLRLCNHDTAYAGERGRDLEGDDAVVVVAEDEDRTVVTRDVALANRTADSPGSILLEAHEVEAQLVELATAGVPLDIAAEPRFCGRCNGPLERVDPDAVDDLPDYVPGPGSRGADSSGNGTGDGTEADRDRPSDLWRCVDCGQYFWQGSHWDRMAATLQAVRSDGAEKGDDG
ncbi:hypothetical protein CHINAEXTREME_10165 [Halobiforma lacisalsi AJ5]|uniref:Mut7-C RNAse domain-containing protein n=1 Tax=Natronobacterium lacisalsi AJ5 TaxID=358396 RepID=M0L6Q4_NATLA|nr:Mut7-C RNAse domain-containing protein [Halobiforma lacisalsi]APW98129.1 hypothetical protein CHINAEXTREME_10165 [Halobiforma lacisalsi AJ5]EMA28109.1 hypothetical protein C445_18758 [Halobiforma lacisalsi AJ5]